MRRAGRIEISQGMEWGGGVLAVAAGVGLWISVLAGVAVPLGDWLVASGFVQPASAAVEVSAGQEALSQAPSRAR